MNQIVEVEITGEAPLLMHSFPVVPITAVEKKSVEEQAELSAYRDPDKRLYIPGIAFARALVSGATYSKGKGRGNLSRIVAGSVMVTPERMILDPQSYTIDSRPVVVPATKGRVMRHRPRFDRWKVAATIEWDPNLMTREQLRKVVDDTGKLVGLLDFRPEKKGPFGRFVVTRWEIKN